MDGGMVELTEIEGRESETVKVYLKTMVKKFQSIRTWKFREPLAC